MKKVLLSVVAVSSLIVAVFAFADKPQHCGHEGHDGGGIVSKLERIVDLSDEQRTQLEALQIEKPRHGKRGHLHQALMDIDPNATDYDEQVNALANKAAERASARVQHMAKMHTDIRAILTEEQVAKIKAFHEEKRVSRDKWRKADQERAD